MSPGATGTDDNRLMRGRFDVAVIGAGPGGIGAACAAARLGARTLVVDRRGFAGGVAAACCCPYLMGFAHDGRQIVGGIADDLVRELDRMGHAAFIQEPSATPESRPIADRPLLGNVITSVEGVRVAANRLLERAGCERLFYARLIGATVEDGRLAAAVIDTAEGPEMICARVFVDATGDAHLVARAGGQVTASPVEDTMTKTILLRVGGVKGFHRPQVEEVFYRLVEQGKIPFAAQDRFMGFATLNPGEVLLNFTLTAGDGLSSAELTRMDGELREQALVTVDWFRRHIPSFVDCFLVDTATEVGVRAGRCIVGKETITCEDVDRDVPVAEPVALGTRWYGGHGLDGFTSSWGKSNVGIRAVPRGALLSASYGNVVAAGRAISAEARVIDTFRLMSRCLAIGQAAGVTAALAARREGDTGVVSYGAVREALQAQGAILE